MITLLPKTKDIELFMQWFTRVAFRFNIRTQKKFFFFLRYLFTKITYRYLYRRKIRGVFFDIRGKVGVKGNAKKRNFLIKKGKISSSTKNYKILIKNGLIGTPTGVLGVTGMIAYR